MPDGNGGTAKSCQQFCAYHSTIQHSPANLYYGVIPSVTTDGYLTWSAGAGDELRVRAYPKRLKVVRSRGPEEFYRLLRQKIGWGAPLVPRPEGD